MTLREKFVHSFLLSILFSSLTWFVVDKLLVEISIIKYFILEIILLVSLKLFNFTKLKLGLN
jgi:hypothetical protein